MTFGEDKDDDDSIRMERLAKAMEVLKITCIQTTDDGKLPDDVRERVGLLFAAMCKLAIASASARAAAEEDGADMDQVDELMHMMLNDLIKVAVVVAMRFVEDDSGSDAKIPEFSIN